MPPPLRRATIHRIRKSRLVLRVRRDSVALVRINAPTIFADQAFQEWLTRVTLHGRRNAPGHRTATWHWPGKPPGENSDIFMLVKSPDDGSDSDMPSHCWERIIRALEAVFPEPRWECIVWLTNMPNLPGDEEWVVISSVMRVRE